MPHIEVSRENEIALVTLRRGKVNAINGEMVSELRAALDELRDDASVRALILTGRKKFFSFGFDVPELYPLAPESFADFLSDYTGLYTEVFIFPKPVIAALNGHTVAAGCMLALACDRRIMADVAAKVALNEITFGSAVFGGSVEMLCACVGRRQAELVLEGGAMYEPREALEIGLVDRVVDPERLLAAAREEAQDLGSKDSAAFGCIKGLLRTPIAEAMRQREAASLRAFVEIWYSEATRAQLQRIEIRK